jgi:hypothetical protein
MKNYTLTKYNGSLQPVKDNKRVVYRTTHDNGRLSHVHAPIHAEYLNWGWNLTIGRIYDYEVLK